MSIVLINNDSTSNNNLLSFLSLQQEKKIIQIDIKNNKYRDELIEYIIKNAGKIKDHLLYTFSTNCAIARASGIQSNKKILICEFAHDTYNDEEFRSCITFFFGDMDNITTNTKAKINKKAIIDSINAASNVNVNHNFDFKIVQAIPNILFNLNKVLDYECGIHTTDDNGKFVLSKPFISNTSPTDIISKSIILSVDSVPVQKSYNKKYLIKYY